MTSRIETKEPAATAGAATPRPWFNDYGKIGDVAAGAGIGEMDADADGELVVAAVNDYDRLRRIEAAAREWAVVGSHVDHYGEAAMETAERNLAAALTSSTPEKP